MTTRRGGKKSGSSANGSVEEYASRRPSQDFERPVTAHSNGTQASKGTFASDFSPPQPVPDIDMIGAPLFTVANEGANGERKSSSPAHDQQTSPVTRKRKRSSPSPAPALADDVIGPTHVRMREAPILDDDYDSDTVQVVHQDDLSDREESADEAGEQEDDDSPESSQSQELVPAYDAMAGTSIDVTPMLSEQPSPATSGSAEDDDPDQATTIAKPLAAALQEVVAAKGIEPIEPEQPEDQPMLDVAQAVEDADEIEEQVRTDEDGRMVVRRGRFGGRRRAQHPNLAIEVAMRRQAHLKSAYRAIARAQKSIAAEITSRSLENLESNQEYHTQAEEYEEISRALDAALAKRKATIQAQHKMKLKQLGVTFDGEKETTVAKCRRQLDDVEESRVDQLEYEFLRIARNAQLQDGHETDDEDDVVPRLKRTAYHFKRGTALDSAFDSRSRLAIETRRATEDMQSRYNMYEMLTDLPEEDRPEKRKNFTVMDERPKTAASKTREGLETLDVLVAAGAEAERVASIPIIPNEQALGLQMLGDLASRPSIVGGRPQSSGSISGQMSGVSRPMPLQLQVPSGQTPIQVQMSPRTQNAMSGRFEAGQMPPPLTPRQDTGSLANRSPEVKRHERRPSSRMDERPNGLHAQPGSDNMRSPARPPIHDPETLHHRIASRDGMLQNSLFGFGSPRPVPNFGGWRQYDEPAGPRRRAASHSDPAPPFGMSADPELHELRRAREHEQSQQGRPVINDEVKDESPRYDPVRSSVTTASAIKWPDSWNQHGASNGRSRETASPKSEQRSIPGTPGPYIASGPASSATKGDQQSHQGHFDPKTGNFHQKTSRQDRHGKSRRQMAKEKKLEREQQKLENGSSERTGTPSMGPATHAGSPFSGMGAPFPNFPPSLQSARDIHPPPVGPFHHSSSYGHHPPLPGFPPPPPSMHHSNPPDHHGLQHHHQHRPSFPPLSGPPGMPPTFSSLFLDPINRRRPPPPPGVDPLHWNRDFRPPPLLAPPNYPPPPEVPQTPHPQSAPGTGGNTGNHFRGPAIAPAGFQQGGPRRGSQLPAFAQQQQQSGGGQTGGGRRRTQSEATFPKFQPLWKPKSPKP